MDHPDALSLREMLGRTHPSEESGEEDDAGTGSDQESEEESEEENMGEKKRKNQGVRKIQVKKFQAKNIECKKTFSLKELLAP